MMRWHLLSLLLCCAACGKKDVPGEGEVALDVIRAAMVHNHVMQDDAQEYFDVLKDGKPGEQIVVIFDAGVASPDCTGNLTLIGKEEQFDMGGKPGTRGAYAVRTLRARSWRCH